MTAEMGVGLVPMMSPEQEGSSYQDVFDQWEEGETQRLTMFGPETCFKRLQSVSNKGRSFCVKLPVFERGAPGPPPPAPPVQQMDT